MAADVVYEDMVKLDGDAEFDALIADLSGLLGKPSEEAAAGQLAETTGRTILNEVRANVSLRGVTYREPIMDKPRR